MARDALASGSAKLGRANSQTDLLLIGKRFGDEKERIFDQLNMPYTSTDLFAACNYSGQKIAVSDLSQSVTLQACLTPEKSPEKLVSAKKSFQRQRSYSVLIPKLDFDGQKTSYGKKVVLN